MKEYSVSDLFFTSWQQLRAKPQAHAEVYALQTTIARHQKDSIEYGASLIAILRRLRKNPLLVDKLNEEQAVDIYNDLTFLNKPWYFFPNLTPLPPLRKRWGWLTPDEQLARTTFDQFIYADNEYTQFLVTQDVKYLARLACTLYMGKFDKEAVDHVKLSKKPLHLLQLIAFTFGHVREAVVKRCKNLLPPAPAGSDDEPVKPQSSGAMWYAIKHEAATTLVFGDFEKLGRSNMYSVLDHLEILAKKQHANIKTH